MRALLPVTLLAALAIGGCYSEAGVAYADPAYGTAAGPSLEYVSPGVQVVADYDYPVFFSDGFYWRWWGNSWYRSPYWNRGWAVGYNVPIGIRGIGRPWDYAHWHGGVAARGYYGGRGGYYGGYRGGYRAGGYYRGAPVYHGGFRGGYHGAVVHAGGARAVGHAGGGHHR